jgi:hypothetical protein
VQRVRARVVRGSALKVDRSALQGDPDAGNADELKAKIRIHAPETPVEFTDDVLTDQEVLLGWQSGCGTPDLGGRHAGRRPPRAFGQPVGRAPRSAEPGQDVVLRLYDRPGR